MSQNQHITADELKAIRMMDDFDLRMLISEISDHGWKTAKALLPLIDAAAYGKWERAAVMVGRAVGAIAGALATGAFVRYADAWSDMQSRVGAAIRDMEAAPAMMQRLVDIANASYSPLDQTVEVYSRNVSVLRDMGRGAAEAADYTEAMNHALVITATRGERATSVTNALSKAMAVGRLQADGLETVLANGGAVAEALAAELGTTVNGLRQMATDGKITGDVIANALISRLGELRERAAEMPATIGDAFTRLQTNLTAFIGGIDQATGASQTLAAAIMLVADNIDVIARVAAVAGVALLTAFAPAILAAMGAGLTALGAAGVAAMRAITVAVMANPLGALAVFVAGAITAIFLFRDEIKDIFGVDLVQIIENAVNIYLGLWVGAYEVIVATWDELPAAMSDLGVRAMNAMNVAIVDGINNAVETIKGFLSWLNPITAAANLLGYGDVGDMISAPKFKATTIDNPNEGAAASTGAKISGIMSDAMSRRYVTFAGEAEGASRSAADAIRDMNSALEETGGGGGGGSGGGGGAASKAADGLKKIKDEALKAAQAAADFAKGVTKGYRCAAWQGPSRLLLAPAARR